MLVGNVNLNILDPIRIDVHKLWKIYGCVFDLFYGQRRWGATPLRL